jgi:hypothetical protein
VKVFSGLDLDLLQSFFAYPSNVVGVYVAGVTPVSRVPIVPEPTPVLLTAIGVAIGTLRRRHGRRNSGGGGP